MGIGIFVLFFIIGLDEIDVAGFVATIRGRYFLAALVSVVASLMASLVVTSDLFGFSFALGLEVKDALALAGILSMSSLGLVAKVLQDGGHLREPIGLKIFAVVIIAEALVLLLVGFTVGEHGNEITAIGVFELLGKMTAFVIASWVLSTRVLPPVISALQRFLDVPELSFGLLIGGLFLMVVAAEEIHLHGSIGALLFGTALSGLPERVRKEVRPGLRSASEGLFVPLFLRVGWPQLRSVVHGIAGGHDTGAGARAIGGQVRWRVPRHLSDSRRRAVRHGGRADGQGSGRDRVLAGDARERCHRTRRLLVVGAHNVQLHTPDADDDRVRGEESQAV